MMATVAGVFMAVVLGVLGLGLQGFQAWVAWKQLQYTVREASGNSASRGQG